MLYLLGFSGQGQAADLRQVRTRSTTCAAATTRSRRDSPKRSGPDNDGNRSWSRSRRNSDGTYRLSFRAGLARADGDRRPRRPGAAVLDPAHASTTPRPASRQSRRRRSASSGWGPTPSSSPVRQTPLELARQQRRHLRRHRLPEHVGGDPRRSPAPRGSSSTTRAGQSARASAAAPPPNAPRRFLTQIEPVLPGITPHWNGQGDRRLLDRLPLDQGLLLLLEGRPVHEVLRRRGAKRRATATSPASTRRPTSRAT